MFKLESKSNQHYFKTGVELKSALLQNWSGNQIRALLQNSNRNEIVIIFKSSQH